MKKNIYLCSRNDKQMEAVFPHAALYRIESDAKLVFFAFVVKTPFLKIRVKLNI